MVDSVSDKPKIEDSRAAANVKNIVLVVDYGSQYTQLITRRCVNLNCVATLAVLWRYEARASA